MPRRRLHIPLLAAIAAAAAPAPARAQDGPRLHGSSANAWLDVSADVWLTPRTGIQAGGRLQRTHLGASPQSAELRLGVQRALGRWLRVAAGGQLGHSTPYGPFPAPEPSTERRLWQHVTIDHRLGRVALSQRWRLEERWIARPHPDDAGGVGPDVTFGMRARAQLRATMPLGPRDAAHAPYLVAADELLKSVGPHHATTRVDQNRASVGAGVRWSPSLRAEASYMNQRILRANGRLLEHGHTVLVSLALVRPAPRGR